MMDDKIETAEQFADRVDDYVKYRPNYPAEIFDDLVAAGFLTPGCVVADVGAGTGIFSRALLERGASVIAVEPNDEMRDASVRDLAEMPGFQAVRGQGEATGLADGAVDLVTVAQALHWMAPAAVHDEFLRITKAPHRLVVVWNLRNRHATPITAAYEAIIDQWGTHHRSVNSDSPSVEKMVRETFGAGDYERHDYVNQQTIGWQALLGRMMSSSYSPNPGHPDHDTVVAKLREAFDANQRDGRVVFAYQTRCYRGVIS